MFIRKLIDQKEIVAGDNSTLRELLHGEKDGLQLRYSIAHASVKPGDTTLKHRLKMSEVYYILEGQGIMYIDDEKSEVEKDTAIYIPPNSVQWIENTSDEALKFLCIVDPAWRPEYEKVVDQ